MASSCLSVSAVALVVVAAAVCTLATRDTNQCLHGPCAPGNDYCGQPFQNAPQYHLMDQHGCAENDPNGPVFDPVHGVIHHFYQIHLAAPPGHGPDYGHFVSKDFINWAPMPVAIWNGLDSSVWPPKVTKYDNEAIFTGSATVVDGAAPDGKSPGVVNIYPGLCNKNDWPSCGTGTLLAIAVAADYANDELLTNWSKPSFNPIMENTQRDPSSAWKTPSGEWRLRTYNSHVYGAASDADFLGGKFYDLGPNPDFRQCECPSFYPLPAATPGFEQEYEQLKAAGQMPTHVHKTSCGGDWWQLGTYTVGAPKTLGNFTATPGWEDLFNQRKIDQGHFYASKDNVYPTLSGDKRRINWGWATVPPASTQTLPREITFNAAARMLQQYPIDELKKLRGPAAASQTNIKVPKGVTDLKVPNGVAKASETVVVFNLPTTETTFGVVVGKPSNPSGNTNISTMMQKTDLPGGDYNVTHYPTGTPADNAKVCQKYCENDKRCVAYTYVVRGNPAGSGDCCLKASVPCPKPNPTCTSGAVPATTKTCGGSSNGVACNVHFVPSTSANYSVTVNCAGTQDVITLLASEKTFEMRLFTDVTFLEAYFQQGRSAMTIVGDFADDAQVALSSDGPVTAASADVYPMKGIWVTPDDVRKAPRVYKYN